MVFLSPHLLECKRIEVLDVVFVIDSSGSIDYDEYNIMKDFMTDLVKKADVGKNQVRFGALKYADDPEVLFYLDTLGTKWEVISVLQNDQPMGGNTYTAEALAFSDHMFTEARGSRLQRGVPQVLIVIDQKMHDFTCYIYYWIAHLNILRSTLSPRGKKLVPMKIYLKTFLFHFIDSF